MKRATGDAASRAAEKLIEGPRGMVSLDGGRTFGYPSARTMREYLGEDGLPLSTEPDVWLIAEGQQVSEPLVFSAPEPPAGGTYSNEITAAPLTEERFREAAEKIRDEGSAFTGFMAELERAEADMSRAMLGLSTLDEAPRSLAHLARELEQHACRLKYDESGRLYCVDCRAKMRAMATAVEKMGEELLTLVAPLELQAFEAVLNLVRMIVTHEQGVLLAAKRSAQALEAEAFIRS